MYFIILFVKVNQIWRTFLIINCYICLPRRTFCKFSRKRLIQTNKQSICLFVICLKANSNLKSSQIFYIQTIFGVLEISSWKNNDGKYRSYNSKWEFDQSYEWSNHSEPRVSAAGLNFGFSCWTFTSQVIVKLLIWFSDSDSDYSYIYLIEARKFYTFFSKYTD